MNCKKAKKLMSAYIDDMLSDSKKSAFEAHLEHCESCKNEFLALKEIILLTGNIKFTAPADFTKEVCGKLNSPIHKKSFSIPRFGVYGTAAAAFVILAAIAMGNPVWEEYKDRISPNDTSAVQEIDKNKEIENVKKEDKNVKKEDKEEQTSKTEQTITSNEKPSLQAQKPTVSEQNGENNADNTKTEAALNTDVSANIQEDNSAAPANESIENNTFNEKKSRAYDNGGDNAAVQSQISVFTAENDFDSSNSPDAQVGSASSFRMAAGGSMNSTDDSSEKSCVTVNSALNLAETEKIIGDILGFEVKGENNVINLSITAEEYTHLAESLSENENFEGFVKINNENIIEISIFVK